MKFSEAIAALEEGKKIRCKAWGDEVWVSNNLDWEGDTDTFLMRCSKEEWEIYEETENMLSFAEVVKGLRERKKFVRKGKNDGCTLFVMGHEIYPRTQFGIQTLKMEDFEATDWIEVK